MRVTLTVNGTTRALDVDPGRTLADVLAHPAACSDGTCGSCTLTLDGDEIRSCLMLAVQASGSRVVTTPGGGTSAGGRPPRAILGPR
ncbi:hypothetical protein Q0Z83_017340 [Actinoplanes sichuanensis]|uniref:2Fe-2S iron-sulfur cluster-binding protein n=1 Tax=Actinoplanes sichuanensis TaxID=512349 RepID=A0ABW4A7K0_9ACTN|nr:2Fe-2S iron-sulfur cluster-binding protein [Actinoplanes sichuanensis]BEL03543.1 hypothetical protein Q0Z83_017340 [Actinoplanes sichuanensis]